MKRKLTAILLCGCIAATALASFSACDKEQPRYEVPDALKAASYIDYADKVDVNVTDYPALADQGMTIVTGFGNGKTGAEADWTVVEEVDADGVYDEATGKSNAAQYFDATKPTVVIIHGVQFDGVGRTGIIHMSTESRSEEIAAGLDTNPIAYFEDSFGSYDGEIEMSKYWYDNGYNVMYFHYERFADMLEYKSGTDFLTCSSTVCDRVWSNEDVRAVYMDGGTACETAEDKAFSGKYSIAEFYAAEYLRAFNAVDKAFPAYKSAGKGVWTAEHSMGGVVAVAGNLLVNLLAENGQINAQLTPERMLHMDAYIGSSAGKTVSWSGKAYMEDSETVTYVNAMVALAKRYGVAIDYYTNEGFIVTMMFGLLADWDNEQHKFVEGFYADEMNLMLENCTMILVRPYYAGVAMVIAQGHNAIREWVLSSILYDAPTVSDSNGVTYTVPTAKTTAEESLKLNGRFFAMEEITENRSETVRCDDDTFEIWK